MVEYGGGIGNGPAGQLAGGSGGGSPELGGHVDFFSSVGHAVNDLTHTILAQPPEVLAIGIVVFFVGLLVLRRAF